MTADDGRVPHVELGHRRAEGGETAARGRVESRIFVPDLPTRCVNVLRWVVPDTPVAVGLGQARLRLREQQMALGAVADRVIDDRADAACILLDELVGFTPLSGC